MDQGLKDVRELLNKDIDRDQYDPNQDLEIRREIRVKYRSLHGKTFEKRRELIAQDDGQKLYHVFSKSNILFSDVKNTQEAVLDSKFLVLASDLNSQKTQAIKIGENNEINLDEFTAKVVTAGAQGTARSGTMDWEHIGKMASLFGKRAHTMDFMLGPLSVQRKEIKKQKSVRITKNKEDLVMPTQLKQGDIKKQENETSNNVNNIYKTLSEVGPVNYFKFVTNPESFSQTVENIFYVSFLARSNVVSIDLSSGQPILETKTPQEVNNIDDVVPKKQIIMGIDIKDWKDIIKTYNITESYIPTRLSKETVSTSGKGWY